ncbi:MAG: type II toxin-antitoxin system VapC family toxin [Sphingorhabdus sp.]
MRLLLDTHAVVWLAEDDQRLPKHVYSRIRDADEIYVSFASAWEYGLKRKKWPESFKNNFAYLLNGIPAQCLAMEFDVHRFAEELPLIHNDPFDRMLIAHALHHGLTLVTKDRDIHRYPVKTFW